MSFGGEAARCRLAVTASRPGGFGKGTAGQPGQPGHHCPALQHGAMANGGARPLDIGRWLGALAKYSPVGSTSDRIAPAAVYSFDRDDNLFRNNRWVE